MKRLTLAIVLVLVPFVGEAQTFRQLGWDQPASSLSDVQAATYKYYLDGSETGLPLINVSCSGDTSPFQCTADFPASTPGPHTLSVSAVNVAGESAKSNELKFNTVVVMAAPQNLRGIQ
jgi:hypothetical protein